MPPIIAQEDLQAVVSQIAGPKAIIAHHTVEPFSKSRNGIMGNHYSLTIHTKDEPTLGSMQILRLFVKTPPDSTDLRDSVVDEWVSLEEVHFFEHVCPLLVPSYSGLGWSPTCYLAKPEALVFEDLGLQGFAVRKDSIYDEASLKSAIATLARFHAASIMAEAKLGRPLNEEFPDAFREKIYTEVGKGGRCNRLGFETLRLLAKRLDLTGGADMVPAISERVRKLVEPSSSKLKYYNRESPIKNRFFFVIAAILRVDSASVML